MTLLYHILDAIFPKQCFNCQRVIGREILLCDECFQSIPINTTFFCSRCHARLADNKKICHRDQKYYLAAATAYDGLAKELIWRLKYDKKLAAGQPLSAILSKYIDGLNFDFENFVVIPMPLHKKRLKSRGFNQAEILALTAAQKLGLPLIANAFIRVKETKAQMELNNSEARRENIKDAFAVVDVPAVLKKNVLLVDDVTTSGATFSEAARVLKENGARKIVALAVAKVGN